MCTFTLVDFSGTITVCHCAEFKQGNQRVLKKGKRKERCSHCIAIRIITRRLVDFVPGWRATGQCTTFQSTHAHCMDENQQSVAEIESEHEIGLLRLQHFHYEP